MQNRYGIKAEIGAIPGFECCGTVVAHGGSPLAWWLMGKRVSCFAYGGCWAEYMVVDAIRCFALNRSTSWENAAGAIANPVTVMMMLDIAKNEKMVVATAGSSSLTRQFVRAAKSKGIGTIVVVRKDDQLENSQKNGAFATLNSEAPDFQEKLTELCKEHKVKLAFDSVAGETGSKVVSSLCSGGIIYVYGFLSGKPINVTGADLIFKDKEIKGLSLMSIFKKSSMFKINHMKQQVISLLDTDLTTDVQATFSLKDFADALMTYTQNLSGGKVHLIIGDAESSQ